MKKRKQELFSYYSLKTGKKPLIKYNTAITPIFVLEGGLQVYQVFETLRHRKPIGFAFETPDGYYWQKFNFHSFTSEDLKDALKDKENTLKLYEVLKVKYKN